MTAPPTNESARQFALLRTMLRIRRFEEAAEDAHRGGEIPGTLHISIGQEAVAVGVCSALERSDLVTSTHRGHGHSIAKGAPLDAMMAELFGRSTGSCHGKGGSMHVADFAAGMLGANGVVGGGMGIAVGAAHGLRVRGSRNVVACFFGDGAVNRGPFLESLNWASTFKLPVLFVCEDNGFAAFTQTKRLTAGEGPAARAAAIGLPARSIDGNDVIEVAASASGFVDRMRAGEGPMFLHARTYRLRGHTIADKGAYRDAEEHARREMLDPILLLRNRLVEFGNGADVDAIENDVEHEIKAAIGAARAAPFPPPEEAFTDVQDHGAPL